MPSRPSRPPATRRGFALLVTIVLVAFLVLILVGLASFTRVETQVADNAQSIAKARQNALFALNLAIGQLQQAAGPDQRVTARAEILDSSPTTPAIDNVTQPFWTGVWRTGPASLDRTNTGTPQRQTSLGSINPTTADKVASASWLVSNPTPATPLNPTTYTGSTTGADPTAVELARNYGATNLTVLAPLVRIDVPAQTIPGLDPSSTTPTRIGQYAYWVCDEGLKAKVNITSPTIKRLSDGSTQVDATSDLAKNLLHFSAPQAVAAHKILPSTLAADFRGNPLADQILIPQQLPFLPSVAPTGFVVNNHADDITTYGFGVLADVRRGGLKRDLTAAFEDNGNTAGRNYAALSPNGTERVYRAQNDSIGSIGNSWRAWSGTTPLSGAGLDGLRWLNLYHHYNLYKSTFPSVNMYGRPTNPSGALPRGIGNPASSRPYSISPRGIGWHDSDFGNQATQVSYGALAPVVLGVRWDVSVRSELTAPGSGLYNLHLNYYPQLVLYNPYSVTIASPSNNFRYARALSSLSTLYLQITVPRPTAGGGPPATTNEISYVALNLASLGNLQRILYNTNFDDTQSFEPGEIRVYGLASSISDDLRATPDGNTDPNGAASEFLFRVNPFGLVSDGHARNNHKTARIQRITTLDTGAPPSRPNPSPLFDTYGELTPIPTGTQVTLRLTGRPTNLTTAMTSTAGVINFAGTGSADVSIPNLALWPTTGGSGGSVLPGITGRTGSGGSRIFQPGTPSVANTGSPQPSNTRPDLTVLVNELSETQVISVFTRKKGINRTGGSSFNNSSITVPQFSGNSVNFNLIYDHYGARWWDELYVGDIYSWTVPRTSSSELQIGFSPTGQTTTSWGNRSLGEAVPDGSRIVLYDVPVQPMVSLGQFMHIQPFYMYNTGQYTAMAFGSMFIGGSLPSPEVPLDQTAVDFTNSTLVLDHSFLANQALFDSFFFSTIPPAGSPPSGTRWPDQWTAFNAANSGTTLTDASLPLLNSRITPITTNNQQPAMADLRDMTKAAANVLLNGAFNINSTSVDAWRSLLSSLSGNDLDIWDASARSSRTISSSNLDNPFVRFAGSNSNSDVNDVWSGIRSLSDTQITDLAEKIVTEVKTRGPFLSMADFLNRRLGSPSDLTRAGTLQAAIDKTNINNSIKAEGVPVNMPGFATNAPTIRPIPANMRDASSPGGDVWNTTIGAPGYLMQQDLVQALSPVMSARSDTFKVRTYGEVRNPVTDAVEGRAWAEAIVQRLPEYVVTKASNPSSGNHPEEIPTAGSDNERFGRRFTIVSFRWLTTNDL